MSISVRKFISNEKPFQKNPLKTKGKINTVVMTPTLQSWQNNHEKKLNEKLNDCLVREIQ